MLPCTLRRATPKRSKLYEAPCDYKGYHKATKVPGVSHMAYPATTITRPAKLNNAFIISDRKSVKVTPTKRTKDTAIKRPGFNQARIMPRTVDYNLLRARDIETHGIKVQFTDKSTTVLKKGLLPLFDSLERLLSKGQLDTEDEQKLLRNTVQNLTRELTFRMKKGYKLSEKQADLLELAALRLGELVGPTLEAKEEEKKLTAEEEEAERLRELMETRAVDPRKSRVGRKLWTGPQLDDPTASTLKSELRDSRRIDDFNDRNKTTLNPDTPVIGRSGNPVKLSTALKWIDDNDGVLNFETRRVITKKAAAKLARSGVDGGFLGGVKIER